MSIAGVLTILWYALAPFLWLIVAGLALLETIQAVAHLRGYRLFAYRCLGANLAALAVGLSALWWIPLLTRSQLAYIATVFDWVALLAAVFGVMLVAWLLLHPLSFLLRGAKRDAGSLTASP